MNASTQAFALMHTQSVQPLLLYMINGPWNHALIVDHSARICIPDRPTWDHVFPRQKGT
jgi:hypothetical protein